MRAQKGNLFKNKKKIETNDPEKKLKMPDAEEEERIICEVTATSDTKFRCDMEQLSKNAIKLRKVYRFIFLKTSENEKLIIVRKINDESGDARKVLELMATKSKIRHERKESNCQVINECQLEQPQSFYFAKMKEFANNLPANTLLPVRNFKMHYVVSNV